MGTNWKVPRRRDPHHLCPKHGCDSYEDRIRRLEEEKLVIRECMANAKGPAQDFDKKVGTALGFLASP